MYSVRHFLPRVLVAFVALSLLVLTLPRPVGATTGPTDFLPAAHYKVPAKVAALYTGRYKLQTIGSDSRLTAASFGVEIDKKGALYGVSQFTGYDNQGYRNTWVAVLYNFHQVAKGVMIIDVNSPGTSTLLARLFLTRAKNGDLSGHILLPYGQYPIRWHKVSAR